VREVRRAVDGIEDPAVRRFVLSGAVSAHFLAEHVVIRVPIGHKGPEHPFDLEVDIRDEIDRTLLADGECAVERSHLHVARPAHGFNRKLQKRGRSGV
jgi:hypothetical protein